MSLALAVNSLSGEVGLPRFSGVWPESQSGSSRCLRAFRISQRRTDEECLARSHVGWHSLPKVDSIGNHQKVADCVLQVSSNLPSRLKTIRVEIDQYKAVSRIGKANG